MPEFWESTYSNNEKMWGEKPTDNAFTVCELFRKQGIKNILIPGFGYGRNAKVFAENGIQVTGIEISETAITRAKKHFRKDVVIHQGSVTNMPFDNHLYEGIYCYSLIHLLKPTERVKLIDDCYQQLQPGGLMVFVAISVNDTRFGVGKKISENTFQSPNGLALYFYDKEAVEREFSDYGIIELSEINEPLKNPTEICWMVVCRKN